MRIYISSLISYLILCSIFLIGIPAHVGIDLYWFYPFYFFLTLYWVLRFKKIERVILGFVLLVLLYSLFTYKYGLPLVIKQLVNIIFSVIVFYYFIKSEKFNSVAIFARYVTLSKIVTVLGFVQVLLFATGLGDFYVFVFPWLKNANIGIRLQSVCQEPSFIGLTLAPVVYFAVFNLFNRTSLLFGKGWSVLFILAYLLTQSSVAYIGLFVMMISVYFQGITVPRILFASFFLSSLFFLFSLAYDKIEFFRVRLNDTYKAYGDEFVENANYRKVNLSTYALMSNLYVTEKILEDYPLTGSGLGTHELNYMKVLPSELKRYMILNSEDANSMGLRLLSETGLIGLCMFLFFIFRNRIASRREMSDDGRLLWVLNSGILVFVFLCLLRNGNYTIHGKIFFFLLLYYTHKAFNIKKLS